jgi:soluble epoxide hydrolase/lipid-phosphate phosphatase
MCIMDDAKVNSGVCVGNDFGAQVCWEAGRMRPDRFIGVFNVAVPVCCPPFFLVATNTDSTCPPRLASPRTSSLPS